QRRRHHQELAGPVQVQVRQVLDRGQVLLGDPRDGDVVDVHLFPADQVQQQVEGALEVGQVNHVRLRPGGAIHTRTPSLRAAQPRTSYNLFILHAFQHPWQRYSSRSSGDATQTTALKMPV